MRTEKTKCSQGVDNYVFMTAQEIPGWMQANRSKLHGGGWVGDTVENLIRKATTGDEKLVAQSEKFLREIEDQVPVSRGWRNVDDVVGAIPNVPAFLAGHPQCMRRRHRVAKDNAPLAIYMDLTASADISAEDMTARGIVLLALVRHLVEHRPVELWVGTAIGQRNISATAAWRIDTAPLDLARSAYHIGASGMARGFGYRLAETLFSQHWTGQWPFSNYHDHCRTAEQRLKPVIGMNEMLYIPPIFSTDPMTRDPVGWLKRTMKIYVSVDDE